MIGKEVLNYVITSTIGKGGMGSVYLAEHKYIKQQKVAIKVINSDMINDFTRNMLKKEAELLASLNHPNIVHFHDYHIDESGDIYLIMEYADGVNLEEYIRSISGLIVEDKICPLFEPILDAVGYAHTRHMIHRDIKPANIIITKEGIPKILDFGIAKIISQRESEDDNLIMGTPSYMSPEQVKGEKLDGRSDIYSLGVLLHQMMTGNPPYDTTTIPERDINRKVVEEPLPRMRSYYKFVSEKVQKVVDKATAKNRDDRYQTCSEFKKALHNAIYPPKVPIWGWISAAVVTLLIVGGGLYYWDYNREKVYYYKDYVEQWGVPKGIHELTNNEMKHLHRLYRFECNRHKVQRVSHINSKGYIIEDNESERNERPLDMLLYYTDKGDISRVKVLDKSGKVLYVKSYNDKLNNVTFQYDDEFGTEKTLGAQTIGYVHAFNDDMAEKGKISRWLLEYDENGYVSTIRYAGFQNVDVTDSHGIHGRKYDRDEKGRVLKEYYLGLDRSAKATKWGLGIKKFYYDSEDNWVKAEYLTIDEEPAYDDADGVCVYTMEYDKYGNVTYALHQEANGELMLPKKHGIAGVHYIYDENGFLTKSIYLGIDKKSVYVPEQGFAISEDQNDEHGYLIKRIFLDPDGNKCIASEGYSSFSCINDEKGNVIEQWHYDLNDNPVEGKEGYAGCKLQYDSIGNITEFITYGIDKKPCLKSDNTSGYKAEYNEMGLLTKLINIGSDLLPCKDNNGIIATLTEYDKRGNQTKISFYDAEYKNLMLSTERIAGWNSSYDDYGNEIERSFFNAKGQLCHLLGRYAKWIARYDEKGNQISIRYYDVDGKLTSFENTTAGFDYKYDERGNIIETKPIGMDGVSLAKNELITKSIYDKFDNIKEEAFYNEKGAATNLLGYHKYICEYNNRNQQIEKRYYNTKGNLTIYNKDKYAIQKDEYDNKGLRTHCYFYGVDGKPVICKEGWASSVYEYNSLGQLVRQLFFDVNQNPTNPKVMVPEGLCKYDKWGNMVYLAAGDGKGNIIMHPQYGWSVLRKEFNIRGQVLYEAYYNDSDEPLICADGYHKVIYGYDKNGNQTSIAWFGTAQEPISQYGVHKQVYTYNDNNQVTERTLYGKKEEPINCDAGFHKIEYKYKDNKTKESYQRKRYKVDKSLLDIQKWDGSQWVSTKAAASINSTPSANDWQQSLRTLNSTLPRDLGEEQNHLVISSFKITGNNSCELVFKAPKSKYTLAEAELKSYLKNIKIVMSKFKSEYLPSNVVIVGVLKDSKERVLNTIRI